MNKTRGFKHRTSSFIMLCAFIVLPIGVLCQDALTLGGHQFLKVDSNWYQVEGPRRYKVNPTVITVRFKAGVEPEAKSSLHMAVGGSVLRENRLGYADVRIPVRMDPFDVIGEYLKSGLVDFAGPNTIGAYDATPSDSTFPNQWHLTKIDAPGAWGIETGTPTVVIAVLD